jgi:zinc-finger binding domain of transposase IS66/Transposase C of IS166 homeodomain
MLEQALMVAQRELHSTSHELQWAQLTIQKKDAVIRLLEERLRRERIGFLGPASETLSDLQLELLVEQEPSTTREEVEAEARREPIATAPTRERKPHPGRKPLPENLPRVEEVIACEANCTCCGEETRLIGYDTSEVLDREPAKWFVRVTKREKRSCRRARIASAYDANPTAIHSWPLRAKPAGRPAIEFRDESHFCEQLLASATAANVASAAVPISATATDPCPDFGGPSSTSASEHRRCCHNRIGVSLPAVGQ